MARYGRRHHELRLRLLPFAYGRPCSRCGEPMLRSQPLDLDHNDDGVGYVGFSHSSCNRSVAGHNPMGIGQHDAVSPQPEASTRW